MENYKEKYENTLSYIKDLIAHKVISKENASKYFPELESEDEKIKEKICLAIKQTAWTNYDKNECFSWLEKQKPVEQDTEHRDTWEYIKEWKEKFGRLPKDEDELASCIHYVMKRQPKQEWSDEDERRIEQICDDLKCCMKNFEAGRNVRGIHFTEIIESNIEWLKSLKPRWKPSEEQMEAVRIAAEVGTANNSWAMEKLKEMYEQLQKL